MHPLPYLARTTPFDTWEMSRMICGTTSWSLPWAPIPRVGDCVISSSALLDEHIFSAFNIPGVKEHAHFLKDVKDARKIRSRILECKESLLFRALCSDVFVRRLRASKPTFPHRHRTTEPPQLLYRRRWSHGCRVRGGATRSVTHGYTATLRQVSH